MFNPVAGNLMLTDGTCVGLRKDLNGIYLLKTALQTAVEQTRDREISLEMTLPDVRHVPSRSVIWPNTPCYCNWNPVTSNLAKFYYWPLKLHLDITMQMSSVVVVVYFRNIVIID